MPTRGRGRRVRYQGPAGRLIVAIKSRSQSDIDHLLAASSTDEDRQYLLDLGLSYCCQHGPDEYAQWFLTQGANASCKLENRLRPLSLAAHWGRASILRNLLDDYQVAVDAPDKDNRTALMYARDTEAVNLLLQADADLEAIDNDGSTALIVALLHHRSTDVICLFIEQGASIEAQDLRKRTVLMQAVWKNRMPIIRMLMDRKVNIAQEDRLKRNVYHHLASDTTRADEKNPKQRRVVANASSKRALLISTLLDADPTGELAHAQDALERTTLHWAAVSGNSQLVKMIVERSRASVNKPERKNRTPLHFAVAKNHVMTVNILLENGAEVNAKTDTGLTALHIACAYMPAQTKTAPALVKQEDAGLSLVTSLIERYKARIGVANRDGEMAIHLAAQAGNWPVVNYLLQFRASDVNARTDTGMTPLHIACARPNTPVDTVRSLISRYKAQTDLKNRSGKTALHLAAQAGNWPVVEYLLHLPGVNLKDRDDFGNTPLIYVASHKNDQSEERKRIVEHFSPWRNAGAMTGDAKSAATGCEATIMDFHQASERKPSIKKRTVHDLLYAAHRADRERPALTITHPESTSFRWIHLPANNTAWCLDLLTKDFIERDASDLHTFIALERSFNHQHRGLKPHSKYMTPLCQTIIRSWSRTGDNNSPIEFSEPRASAAIRAERDMLSLGFWTDPFAPRPHASRPLSSRRYSNTDLSKKKDQRPRIKRTKPRVVLPVSDSDSQSHDATISSMYLFTPFLHFETFKDRQAMQELADMVFKSQDSDATNITPGAALFRAYLQAPNFPLHMRRTLDQFFYRNIDTTDRDKDQVIYRYQNKSDVLSKDPVVKLLMVDQLWMWVLHDDLILTSFPERWSKDQSEGGDRSSMWEDIREIILSRNRDPVRDVHELAMIIAGRCFGAFDRRLGSYDLQFLDMFEASIGDALDMEVKLFERFNRSSEKAFKWLADDAPVIHDHSHGIRGTSRKTPDFIRDLFNIGPETNLLTDIKDIIDELDMLTMLFECQEKQVLPHLEDAMTEIGVQHNWPSAVQRKARKTLVEHQRTIAHPKEDVERMKKLATRIERSIKDLLDLKQKQVNVIEARASRTQAENTASQGNILMIFTTFSVIFLPLSFIASVFTINISQLPQGNNGNLLSIHFVTKYLFGVGIPVAVLCVLIALSIERMMVYFWRGWAWTVQWLSDTWADLKEVRARRKRDPHWKQEMVVLSIPPHERATLHRSKAMTRINSAPIGGWDVERQPPHLGPPHFLQPDLGQPLKPILTAKSTGATANGHWVS